MRCFARREWKTKASSSTSTRLSTSYKKATFHQLMMEAWFYCILEMTVNLINTMDVTVSGRLFKGPLFVLLFIRSFTHKHMLHDYLHEEYIERLMCDHGFERCQRYRRTEEKVEVDLEQEGSVERREHGGWQWACERAVEKMDRKKKNSAQMKKIRHLPAGTIQD